MPKKIYVLVTKYYLVSIWKTISKGSKVENYNSLILLLFTQWKYYRKYISGLYKKFIKVSKI